MMDVLRVAEGALGWCQHSGLAPPHATRRRSRGSGVRRQGKALRARRHDGIVVAAGASCPLPIFVAGAILFRSAPCFLPNVFISLPKRAVLIRQLEGKIGPEIHDT